MSLIFLTTLALVKENNCPLQNQTTMCYSNSSSSLTGHLQLFEAYVNLIWFLVRKMSVIGGWEEGNNEQEKSGGEQSVNGKIGWKMGNQCRQEGDFSPSYYDTICSWKAVIVLGNNEYFFWFLEQDSVMYWLFLDWQVLFAEAGVIDMQINISS